MNKQKQGMRINNIVPGLYGSGTARHGTARHDTRCAPGLVYEAGSCARLAVLNELASAYNNTTHEANHIKLSHTTEMLNPQKYKLYLVTELHNRLGDICTTQKCWGRQNFVQYMDAKARDEFIKYTHRPKSPEGKFEWLNTYDINNIMAQYEIKYIDFKFFGAVPMDFAELPSLEISKVDYDKYYKNGKTKLGVIFNLDNHDDPGSHWTAMFTDFEKGCIFYFDSYGIKPESRVRALMRQQTKFMESKGISIHEIRIDYNKVQHQKEDSECGVYSVNFLIRQARGDDFDKLCTNPIPDKQINKCRRVYFDRPHTKK